MMDGESPSSAARGVIEAMAASLRGAGETLAAQGFIAEAQAELQKAAALAPDDPTIRAGLARLALTAGVRLEASGSDRGAENCYRQSYGLSQASDEATAALTALLRRRSEVLALQGDAEGAGFAAAQARLLHPGDAELLPVALRRAARAILSAESALASLSGYVLALADNPDNRHLARALADGLCDHAQPMIFAARQDEAVGLLREARRLTPDSARADRLLAMALYQTAVGHYNFRRLAEAEAAAWEALSLAPDFSEAAQLIDLCARHSSRRVPVVADSAATEAAGTLSGLLQIQDVSACSLVRKGGQRDGGYVMADFRLEGTVAYSLGIGNDVSWDLDMASAGCTVFQYDHTIERLPAEHANFRWFRLGIAAGRGEDPLMRTLDEAIVENGHQDRDDMVLKIDIEGYEWNLLAEMSPETLGRFTQIVGEFHDMPTMIVDPDKARRMLAALEKLDRQFALIHMHANNWASAAIVGGITLPSHLELTFLRRDRHSFSRTTRKFPGEFDHACIPGLPEYALNPFS